VVFITNKERNMYKVSVSKSLRFECGIYRVFGTRESPGFGLGIYGTSVQANLPDSDAISVQVKLDGCLVFNLQCIPCFIGKDR